MKKSVYSIVLTDDVIRAVDKEAYRLGTNRSNLINQILAEHLSCVTPEMRMRDIFETVARLAGQGFQIPQQRSASLMTLRTALEYKYRPTISYKIELERVPQKYIGKLSIGIRTLNSKLIEMFDNFFLYWTAMERERLERLGVGSPVFELSPLTYVRLLFNTDADEEQTAEAISRYLECLNVCVQRFFSDPSVRRDYSPFIEEQYSKMLEKSII